MRGVFPKVTAKFLIASISPANSGHSVILAEVLEIKEATLPQVVCYSFLRSLVVFYFMLFPCCTNPLISSPNKLPIYLTFTSLLLFKNTYVGFHSLRTLLGDHLFIWPITPPISKQDTKDNILYYLQLSVHAFNKAFTETVS